MSFVRRSTRAQTTKQSYVEVPEGFDDTIGDELSSSEPERAPKRRRRVVVDSDDDLDETTFPSSTSLASPSCAGKQATASASLNEKQATASAFGFMKQATASASKRVRRTKASLGMEAASTAKGQTSMTGFLVPVAPSAERPTGDKGKGIAAESAQPRAAAPAVKGQTKITGFVFPVVPRAERPTGDKGKGVAAEIAQPPAAAIEADEDSDEEDDYIPGPDPTILDEEDEEIDTDDVYPELDDSEVEVDENFAQKLRIILDLLCQRVKSISYREFRDLPEKDRPVTYGSWRVLNTVGVDFLQRTFIPAIPLQVQELFSKQEWCLEDLLSLPKVKKAEAADQGLYGNFPTGNLESTPKIGCECYVGSTGQMLTRIDQHLKVSRKYTPETLPEHSRKSLHYRVTCRKGVECNFRKLAVFKQRIQTGYLTILESVFMILFGTYNNPGYCARWATESSYKMVEEIRAQLDLPPIVWRGLNAALPLRQGCITRNSKTPSPCCNPACTAMTYPRFMAPNGPKHSRILADPCDPLGGYLCRRCESYQERHGVLPDRAKLEKLVSNYETEVAKSNLRAAGQPVICSNCGSVEGPDGAINSANSSGARHIASNGVIRCLACDVYLRNFGKERDIRLAQMKAARDQVNADREAGRQIRCKHCRNLEKSGRRRFATSKEGGVVCNTCYKKGRR